MIFGLRASKLIFVAASLAFAGTLGYYLGVQRDSHLHKRALERKSHSVLPAPERQFQEDFELLVSGQNMNLDRFVNKAEEYLPYLIEATRDHRVLPHVRTGYGGATITNATKDSFELIRHLGCQTASDCARTVLAETCPFKEDTFLIGDEELTILDRQKASEQWREWYDKNKDDLYWDDKQKVFRIWSADK